jgi:hypothetical protein
MGSIIGIFLFLIYSLFQSPFLQGGDSGDFVTAGYLFGVAHPPGFPLYTTILHLVAYLPIGPSVAWRAGLLSTIPMSMCGVLLYMILRKFSVSKIVAFLTATGILSNYILFQYAIVQEVFALHLTLVLTLLYLALLTVEYKSRWYMYVMGVVFGLAITHHPLSAFIFPALCIAFIIRKKKHYPFPSVWKLVLSVLAGMSPLILLWFQAHNDPIVNWERAMDVPSIIRVFVRERYGTFQSGSVISQSITIRLLNVKQYFEHLKFDFGIPILLIALYGAYAMWKSRINSALIVFLAFLSFGPFYYFYASYSIEEGLSIGIFEKFLITSYGILFILIGCGFENIIKVVRSSVRNIPIQGFIYNLVVIGIALFTILTIRVTFLRISSITSNSIIESYGLDILSTPVKNSIVLLSGDTTLFPSQYFRYVNFVRPDLIILYSGDMKLSSYYETIFHTFPALRMTFAADKSMIQQFIDTAIVTHAVYSNTPLAGGQSYTSVQEGLLYRIYPIRDVPSDDATWKRNTELWDLYREPQILSEFETSYRNGHADDVMINYAAKRYTYAKYLLSGGRYTEAVSMMSYIRKSYSPFIQSSDVAMYIAIGYLEDNQCDKAKQGISELDAAKHPDVYLIKAYYYLKCEKRDDLYTEMVDKYNETIKQTETPLSPVTQ